MKTQFVRRGLWRWAVVAGLVMLAGVTLVWGFAEEHLYFRDPHTGETSDRWEISTIHDDLTYALALVAGFDITDSITLQIWNQLVDSEQLGPGEAVSYTNCTGGGFYPTPDPSVVCPFPVLNCSHAIWPQWNKMAISTTCVTSRFGPYSPFFHFPHLTGTLGARDIGALRDWAWGLTQTLVAYDTYAWGRGPLQDPTVMQARYRYTRTAVITTGMEAGSLEAFGTYLHSLADAYSHEDCIAAMDALGMPWATHTITPLGDTSVPACDYNPFNYSATDVHGREFYTYTESYSHTDAAIRAVYAELVSRSLRREGKYFPISLDTRLMSITGTPTLSEAVYAFVHNWDYDQPSKRREYTDLISDAALTQRQPVQRIYLPLTIRQ